MSTSQSDQIRQLGQFRVCQVSDALGPLCAVETTLFPVDARFQICGPAFTVKCSPDDNLTIHHALHLAAPGDVLVVESGLECHSGLWGELMSLSAKARRLGGTVIDGGIRDRLQIKEIGYPVFARRFLPKKTQKEKYGEIQCSVRCGAITVNPGDILLADADGSIAIPRSALEETLALTGEVSRKESEIEKRIRAGDSIFEILQLSRFVLRHTANRD